MEGLGAKWAEGIEPVPEREIGAVTEMDQEVGKGWLVEAGQAAQPRFRPLMKITKKLSIAALKNR